jgi:hypothetical protein
MSAFAILSSIAGPVISPSPEQDRDIPMSNKLLVPWTILECWFTEYFHPLARPSAFDA